MVRNVKTDPHEAVDHFIDRLLDIFIRQVEDRNLNGTNHKNKNENEKSNEFGTSK